MGEYKLIQALVNLSNSDKWDEAKLEWIPHDILYAEELETCLCGHPIKELCIIRNKMNDNLATVGNCCINKFTPMKTKKLFVCASKVKKDITKSFNSDFIQLAYERGRINTWEKGFYLDTWRKRNLTCKQMIKKCTINVKILTKIKVGERYFIDDDEIKLYNKVIDRICHNIY